MDEKMIAWAAGLFEGEGFINFRPNGKPNSKLYVRIGIRSTDHDVLERFCAVVRAGKVHGPFPAISPAGGEAKDYSEWRTFRSKDVRRILEAFVPYLGKRRLAKANEAFALLEEIKSYDNSCRLSRTRGSVHRASHRVNLKIPEGV